MQVRALIVIVENERVYAIGGQHGLPRIARNLRVRIICIAPFAAIIGDIHPSRDEHPANVRAPEVLECICHLFRYLFIN